MTLPADTSEALFKKIPGDRISVWCTSLGVGDTICATPTVRELRRRFPFHGIDVYSYYPELFAYNPGVNASYFFDEKKELEGSFAKHVSPPTIFQGGVPWLLLKQRPKPRYRRQSTGRQR